MWRYCNCSFLPILVIVPDLDQRPSFGGSPSCHTFSHNDFPGKSSTSGAAQSLAGVQCHSFYRDIHLASAGHLSIKSNWIDNDMSSFFLQPTGSWRIQISRSLSNCNGANQSLSVHIYNLGMSWKKCSSLQTKFLLQYQQRYQMFLLVCIA